MCSFLIEPHKYIILKSKLRVKCYTFIFGVFFWANAHILLRCGLIFRWDQGYYPNNPLNIYIVVV